jgi:hypothetical protein
MVARSSRPSGRGSTAVVEAASAAPTVMGVISGARGGARARAGDYGAVVIGVSREV